MNSTTTVAPELPPLALPFGAGGWGIRVRAASRLSFTLIDLNGEGGRRNGMASMSLRDPHFQAVVRPAEQVAVVDDDGRARHMAEIVEFLEVLSERRGTPPAEVVVERPLPAHNGFGSKTTTLLAIGKAYMRLWGNTASTEELAQAAGRAGTSGASVNLIDTGGFLIDGGQANPPDFGEDPQRYLVPSRFASVARKPPPLVSMPFPPWPILIFLGVGTELSGAPELDWFRETLPIPVEEAQRTAHHMLMHMAPAVAESDYDAFCEALNVLTYEHHYKQEQIEVQSEEVKTVFREARNVRKAAAIDAIGLSVTGPMCFVFSRRPAAAVAWIEALRARGLVGEHWWSCAQNHPVVLEGVPA